MSNSIQLGSIESQILSRVTSNLLEDEALLTQLAQVKAEGLQPTDHDMAFIESSLQSLAQQTEQGSLSLEKVAKGFVDIFRGVTKRLEFQQQNPPHEPLPHFFMIRDGEGNVRGYLMGTVHAIDPKAWKLLDQKMQKILKKCDRLFLEVANLNGVKEAELASIKKQLALVDTQELVAAFERYLNLFGKYPNQLPNPELKAFLQSLVKMTPVDQLLACVEKYLELTQKIAGPHASYSVDEYLHAKFSSQRKTVCSLEPFDVHMKFLEKTYTSENGNLDGLLNPSQPEEVQKVAETAMRVFWHSDTPIQCESAEDALRNGLFCKQILQDLTDNPTSRALYACGIAHLYDETGLINFLESQGYEVLKTV